ncbi:hypothetical protein K461DRAFT_272324 [Myriangium duriaei CBS 260.36]|uniref:FAD-binding domain-containing protein n=1 Tax=Myriangium duriaei CBS 260.36 TaxID=1168546 RepID=A0A9P4IUT9_9PEZI|nr:hypothetical protein K461DRAFT_272324 [Myriangium duriaei CBS 260.36]
MFKSNHTLHATVMLNGGDELSADLVIGADGIRSQSRPILMGKSDPPIATGDLAYRVLLGTDHFKHDPELQPLPAKHEVHYWMGPGAHAVSYPLRKGSLMNVVLLVPDDMLEGVMTTHGIIEEMQALYEVWDRRIPKTL